MALRTERLVARTGAPYWWPGRLHVGVILVMLHLSDALVPQFPVFGVHAEGADPSLTVIA
jgi:hypothetical protein